jgi:hypothetical protein
MVHDGGAARSSHAAHPARSLTQRCLRDGLRVHVMGLEYPGYGIRCASEPRHECTTA